MGAYFRECILALIILNVIAVILESEDSIREPVGQTTWDTFEVESII